MQVAVHNYYSILNEKNNMFLGVGDVTISFFLKQMESLLLFGKLEGVDFSSSAMILIEDTDAILFVDYPSSADPYFKKALESKKPLFLLVWESSIINPRNIQKSKHSIFERVFTYDDALVDGVKYIKTPYSFDFPKEISKSFESKKLCCLISGNKYSYHPNELYSERKKIIEWFENYSPDVFSLYGRGWDKIIPPRNFLDKIVNRFDAFKLFRHALPITYKGEVLDKTIVLSNYKFSICFENAKDVNGYISEKIFDSFFSGCVPIYLGTENILDYIPKECFIDYRVFNCIEEMYCFIDNMEWIVYKNYLDSIEAFLLSDSSYIFTNKYFSKTIIKQIKSVVSDV